MKTLIYTIVVILLVLETSVLGQTKTPIEEQELTLQISTFARQEKFVSEKEITSLKVKEGLEEISPEILDIKQIKQTIIAIDNSKSMKYILGDLAKQLEKSLPKIIASPTMLVTFNEEIEVISTFTTSRSELVEAIRKMQISQKNTFLFKAINDIKEFSHNSLTHLILITDGVDTENKIVNVKELLSLGNLTISYINWAYRDPSIGVDEPGYNPNGEARTIKVCPALGLSNIAKRSGGDVINLTSWKPLRRYIEQNLKSTCFLYTAFWYTNNPMNNFYIDVTKKD